MAEGLQRVQLQKLAQTKADDAVLLLHHERFSNAYYLAGYALELGLKACIARRIAPETIPDLAFVKDTYQHDLKKLIGVAGLGAEFTAAQDADAAFSAYWGIVGEWKESARYQSIDNYSAQLMVQAVVDPNSGIFQWIKTYW